MTTDSGKMPISELEFGYDSNNPHIRKFWKWRRSMGIRDIQYLDHAFVGFSPENLLKARDSAFSNAVNEKLLGNTTAAGDNLFELALRMIKWQLQKRIDALDTGEPVK